MVAGDCRERAQHALDRLCAQTALDELEIVVVDLGKKGTLSAPAGAPVEILAEPGIEQWADARRIGLTRSSAPVVAFVEEHCFTDPHWAEDLAIGAGAGTNSAWVVDAAFGRYAREAADFAGGRAHDRPMRD